jgi:hypothetical protein
VGGGDVVEETSSACTFRDDAVVKSDRAYDGSANHGDVTVQFGLVMSALPRRRRSVR